MCAPLLVVLLGLASACASDAAARSSLAASEPMPSSADDRAEGGGAMPGGAPAPPALAVAREEGRPKGDAPAHKQLIYQAEVVLAVFEVDKAVGEVDQLARELGGYLVQRSDRYITVRVPSERFREALARVLGFGDVLTQRVSVEDVTDRFFDLQARIRAVRAVRDRLAELLGKAANVNEALAVERELRRVGEELEQLEGQLKRLSELIAFSTITARFQPPPREPVDQNVRLPFPWLDELGLPHLLRL